MLRKLVIARQLGIIFEKLWQSGDVPEDWKKANVILVFKKGKEEDLGYYRLFSFTSIPGKAMEQLILDTLSKYIKDKNVTGSSQHTSMKGKSHLTNLLAFCDELTGVVDKGRAVNVLSLNFAMAFDTVSHNILIGKLMKDGLGKWIVMWRETR